MDRNRLIAIATEPVEIAAMQKLAERVMIVTRGVWMKNDNSRMTQEILAGSRQPSIGRHGAAEKSS